jgi:hypothetical protein
MRLIVALIASISFAITGTPAIASKKKSQSDIVITKPADKSSPTLQTAPGPAGPTPIPYPNTNPPASGRSTR